MTRAEADLAPAITRAASRQTYYTIRFLVDRARVGDAYRAYAYLRWVDDVLDAETPSGSSLGEAATRARVVFLERQAFLLDECLRGKPPRARNAREALLVELLRDFGPGDVGLGSYLQHLMLVMEFDVRRRGRLVSQVELDEYTRWLATGVTDAMHHFIGNTLTPRDESCYHAAAGAHILHMLRDTHADLRAGYFNVPREVLERHSIGPEDVHSDAYRAWVGGRVRLAAQLMDNGRAYLARHTNRRHRIAGLAYIARFQWLIETLQRDDFRLRPDYAERTSLSTALKMGGQLISWLAPVRVRAAAPGRSQLPERSIR